MCIPTQVHSHVHMHTQWHTHTHMHMHVQAHTQAHGTQRVRREGKEVRNRDLLTTS